MEFHCELDEYAELTKELKDSGIVRDHKKNLKTYKNSFIGKEAVDWLVKYKNLGNCYTLLFKDVDSFFFVRNKYFFLLFQISKYNKVYLQLLSSAVSQGEFYKLSENILFMFKTSFIIILSFIFNRETCSH